jgi:hypothetical protein
MARTQAWMMGYDQGEPTKDCGNEDDNTGRGQGERRQKTTHQAMSVAHASKVSLAESVQTTQPVHRSRQSYLDASLGKRELLPVY